MATNEFIFVLRGYPDAIVVVTDSGRACPVLDTGSIRKLESRFLPVILSAAKDLGVGNGGSARSGNKHEIQSRPVLRSVLLQ